MIIVWSSLYSHSASYFLLSSVFGANLSALLHIHEPHGPGVLWSLAVEEHFYLLWPVVVLVSSRRTLVALSTCIFVVTPVLRGVFAARGMDANLIYMLSWFRFDGLAAGALLAVWARSRFVRAEVARTISVALLLCCALLTVIGARYGFLGTHTPVAVALRYTQAYLGFGALFVLAFALRGSVWTSPLRWPLLQLSGALSYCLYLVHLSVGDGYEWMVRRIGIAPGASLGPGGALVLRGIVIILASFAIALLTRRYVEEPCLALKDRVAGRTRSAEEPSPRLEPVQA
jgi:peptidoglycan/LPS O-acetylase OafA/YrhL